MSSTRRSTGGELPDGVVPSGQEENPNPPEQVAAQRAKFEDKQRELQHDRQDAADQLRTTQTEVEDQYQRAIQDPEHQAFMAEQLAHELNDPQHEHGGQDRAGQDLLVSRLPQDFDLTRPGALPTTPHASEESRDP